MTPEDLNSGEYVYILARTRISDDLEETKRAQKSMVIDAKSAVPYEGKGYKPEEVEAYRNKLIKDVTEDHLEIVGAIRIWRKTIRCGQGKLPSLRRDGLGRLTSKIRPIHCFDKRPRRWREKPNAYFSQTRFGL
ncbi:hypothetical protein GCM10011339_30430 [Echinicola rosea]|uniref:Uncharacterized protein n=1 Tax=Echinicola rosea TaxID=1807691 RepID=A0ABQ1V6G7_9BACT|nr:hypothetical protein GCM10011339_30430 [Echinicola rosea]